MLPLMREVTDRYQTALETSKLHILRTRSVIDASRAQIVSMSGLIEDSRKLLAMMRPSPGPYAKMGR